VILASRRRVLRGACGLASLLLAGCGTGWRLPFSHPATRSIGYLDSDSSVTAGIFEGLREGLRELGYIEGQHLVFEVRDAAGDPARLPKLAAELAALPVELIVVPNPVAGLHASRASSLPVVAAGGNIVGARLVASISRPEGTVTGVATNSAQLIGKWVELLVEAVPTVSVLAVIRDPGGAAVDEVMQQVQRASDTLKLRILAYDLNDLAHLPALLSTAKSDGANGLVLASGGALG
jgi:putative tryptophan/tyrosine transport system substrate-binding protein